MGILIQPSKAQKNAIGGAGIGGIGAVQQAAVPVGGAALNLTAWAGREVNVRVSAECRYRWATLATPTTVSAVDATSAAAPAATGGGWLYAGRPNFRDVPPISSQATSEGVFLIIVAAAGTVDVTIEATG